jgi:hypothetical protein
MLAVVPQPGLDLASTRLVALGRWFEQLVAECSDEMLALRSHGDVHIGYDLFCFFRLVDTGTLVLFILSKRP